MRTITIEKNVYKFDELSQESKWNVQNRIAGWYDFSDEQATLKKFEEWANCSAKFDYDHQYYFYHGIKSYWGEEIEQLTGKRLATWIMNNLWYDTLFTNKKFEKGMPWDKNYKCRTSRIILKETCCPLTGFYLDDDMLQPWRDFLKKPCEYTNILDLIEYSYDAYISAICNQEEYNNSEENAKEYCEANDYEFYEDGSFAA